MLKKILSEIILHMCLGVIFLVSNCTKGDKGSSQWKFVTFWSFKRWKWTVHRLFCWGTLMFYFSSVWLGRGWVNCFCIILGCEFSCAAPVSGSWQPPWLRLAEAKLKRSWDAELLLQSVAKPALCFLAAFSGITGLKLPSNSFRLRIHHQLQRGTERVSVFMAEIINTCWNEGPVMTWLSSQGYFRPQIALKDRPEQLKCLWWTLAAVWQWRDCIISCTQSWVCGGAAGAVLE